MYQPFDVKIAIFDGGEAAAGRLTAACSVRAQDIPSRCAIVQGSRGVSELERRMRGSSPAEATLYEGATRQSEDA